MKALVLKTIETLEVMDVPMPKLQPGLVLVKVSVDSKTRAEVMQITNIFRAKIVDVQPKTLTIEFTGN